MASKATRIGNFTWGTTPLVFGVVLTGSCLVSLIWVWMHDKSQIDSLPPAFEGNNYFYLQLVTTFLLSAVSVVVGYWAAGQFVRWVAVGESFTFATLRGLNTLDWSEVEGIEFEIEHKTIPLVVLPVEIVVAKNCVALISLKSGRDLRGRLSQVDVAILHSLLSERPQLDAHFSRALASPRATVQTFVDAVMENRLLFAGKFLDFAFSNSADGLSQAESCATRLKDVIDELWFLDYEEISDDPETESPYSLVGASIDEVPAEFLDVAKGIKLVRSETDDLWRFDSETVKLIIADESR